MGPKKNNPNERGESSKWKKGASRSNTDAGLDKDTFVNTNAQKFHTLHSKRCVGPERGFVWKLNDRWSDRWEMEALEIFAGIKAQVEQYGWMEFMRQPSEGDTIIAREFYANLPMATEMGVFVRNKRVPVTSEAINDLFGLSDIEGYFEYNREEDDKYYHEEDMAHPEFQKPTDDQIVALLCNISFDHNENIPLNAQLHPSHLNTASKVWYYFITSRLMPTLSGRVMGDQRILLLYCIMRGVPVNVGNIIRQAMIRTRNFSPFVLNFPITITEMCKRAGVPFETTEKTIPRSPFTATYILRELRKVREVERVAGEAREARRNAANADATVVRHTIEQEAEPQWDAWMAHTEMVEHTQFLEASLIRMMGNMRVEIPPQPRPFTRFAQPSRRQEEQDDGGDDEQMDEEH